MASAVPIKHQVPVNRQWRLASRPKAVIDDDTFRLDESPVLEPGDGEFVVRVVYLSLAPVQRAYIIDGGVIEKPLPIGEVMRGRGVGYVVASRHPGFAEGDVVHGPFGWQDYAVSDGSGLTFKMRDWAHSIATGIGILGLTGFTAYFGLFDIGQVRAGETVLVSGAVGGVGSVAGQLAAIAGCRAVGIAGSDEKCRLGRDRLGYSAMINYREDDIPVRIRATCKDGIDVYFDNVGGDILEAAIDHIAQDGRIVLCGSISQYLSDGKKRGPANYFDLVYRNASMRGFHIYSFANRFAEAEARMARWLREGRLVYAEDRLHGLEQMPAALGRLFSSSNTGKQVVQIADDPISETR